MNYPKNVTVRGEYKSNPDTKRIELRVSLAVVCAECDTKLESCLRTIDGVLTMEVWPCDSCKEEVRDEG